MAGHCLMVHRVWKAGGLKPHMVKRFKLSNDPQFIEKLVDVAPEQLDLHLILDNYATHKHPKVRRWIEQQPRCHLHFIPTSSSWLNLVERSFRDLTDKRFGRRRLKRSSRKSVALALL